MRQVIQFLSIILLLIFQNKFTFSQDWQFVKEEDGIHLFTREEPGFSVKAYRGETIFKGDMDRALALIIDVENFDDWDEDISELKVLERIEGVSFTYYLAYDLPWPVTDRDLCVRAEIVTGHEKGEIWVVASPLPDLVPLGQDRVRIRHYWQKWSILPLDDGNIRLSVEGFADPGGSIPAWISNMVITQTPFNTIREVRDRSN